MEAQKTKEKICACDKKAEWKSAFMDLTIHDGNLNSDVPRNKRIGYTKQRERIISSPMQWINQQRPRPIRRCYTGQILTTIFNANKFAQKVNTCQAVLCKLILH